MSAGPYLNLYEAVIYNAIACLQPILDNLLDEFGQPITVPMRSIYADLESEFSEVVVTVQPGAIRFMSGMNLQLLDPLTNTFVYQVRASESRIVLIIKARKDAERWYLLDALVSGILAGYSTDTSGNQWEQAVLHNLGLCGIIVTGFGAVDAPSANLDEPRPEGQVYELTLPLECDLFMQWSQNPLVPTGFTIFPTVTTDAGTPPYAQATDTTIII